MGNSTEAPTSGKTAENLESRNVGLTPDQLAFVTLMATYFGMNGKIMPVTEAVSDYMFKLDEYAKLLKSEAVGRALQERGVRVSGAELRLLDETLRINSDRESESSAKPEPETCSECGRAIGEDTNHTPGLLAPTESVSSTWQERTLDPIQLIVANAIMDLVDTRSQKKKLQDLGVSTATWQAWLKQPDFQAYMRESSKAMLKDNEHEVYLALVDKVRMGDQKAISTYLAMQGIYVADGGASSGGTGTHANLNFQNLLVRILEIITEETDQGQAFIIGERLRALIGIQETASALVNATQPVETHHEDGMPVIAKTRQLSPHLQELMSKGVGNE